MKRLNVCLMNDSFPPIIDGVANTVLNYANILNEKYGNVIVATPNYPGFEYSFPFEVLPYASIDTTKKYGYRTGVPFDINYLSQFNHYDIDIIHTHCPVTSTFLARTVRNSIHKPIILTYHTKYDIDIKKMIDTQLAQQAATKALVSNIEACDEIWTVSRGAGENLKSLGCTKDYIIMNNGVDFDKGKSSKEAIDSIRSLYHLNPDIPTFLFVGRMMWYKGIRIILDALKIKDNVHQDFRMLFVGDGVDMQEIKAYTQQLGLNDKCIFAGTVRDRKVLKDIFSSCDLFLFPSTFDTNGIVVREAASAGLGSVLIEGSCAAEDTKNQINTIWISENADSLANVLIHGTMDFFRKIGENAQQQLYISWQESVDNAYKRYEYISERYHYDNKGFTLDITENFFGSLSDLSIGLSKARQARINLDLLRSEYVAQLNKEVKRISASIEETLGGIDANNRKILDDFSSNLHELLHNANTDFENTLKQFSENLDNLQKNIIRPTDKVLQKIRQYSPVDDFETMLSNAKAQVERIKEEYRRHKNDDIDRYL